MSDPALRRPFDIYTRYRTAEALAPLLAGALDRTPGELRWAEAGAWPGEALAFPGFGKIALYDRVEDLGGQVPRYRLHDITAAPLPERADAVMALDVLEHLPPDRRRTALHHLGASTEHYLILAGPWADPAVEQAEGVIRDFVRVKLGVEQPYFDEHAALGLPDRAETMRVLKAEGFESVSWPTAYLPLWSLLSVLHYTLDHEPRDSGLMDRFNEMANTQYFEAAFRDPSYRHFILAWRNVSTEGVRELQQELHPLLHVKRGAEPDWTALTALVESARLSADRRKDQWIAHLERQLAASERALESEREHVRKLIAYKASVERFRPLAAVMRAIARIVARVRGIRP